MSHNKREDKRSSFTKVWDFLKGNDKFPTPKDVSDIIYKNRQHRLALERLMLSMENGNSKINQSEAILEKLLKEIY